MTPQVTIVVVPRERFSAAERSLKSIVEHTATPYELVYVDAGSPARVRRRLQSIAREQGFEYLQHPTFLAPNQARNLGLARVRTPYVAFVDNDVIVSPGWLAPLIDCAESTGAAVVEPLTCQFEPLHETIHCAGGVADIRIERNENGVQRFMVERIARQGRTVAEVRPEVSRSETQLAEFHCVLARRDLFDKIGQLDNQLLNTKEHVDFSILVQQAGGSIYLEPASVVTYLGGAIESLADLYSYMVRWSDAWELASLVHLRDKWQLTEDAWLRGRFENRGWRRRTTIVRPFAQWLCLGRRVGRVEALLSRLERVLNRIITRWHGMPQRPEAAARQTKADAYQRAA